MRQYGKLQTTFWTDPEIADLRESDRMLFIYLITGPHSTALGCYRAPLAYISEDIRQGVDRVSTGCRNLENAGFIRYDHGVKWVFVRHFLRWNAPENGSVGVRIESLFDNVPEKSKFYRDLCSDIAALDKHVPNTLRHRVDTVLTRCGHPEPEPEPEPEPKPEPEPEYRTEDRTLVRSAKPRSKPPVITIPIVKGQEHAISEDDIAEWQACFPAVDVQQELRSIRAWNLANPSRRKTARGIKNHVRSWLEKEQNRGGHKGNGNGQGRETVMDYNLRVVREMQAAREAAGTEGTTYEHEGNEHASK